MRCTLQGEAWVHFVMESKYIVQVSQVNTVSGHQIMLFDLNCYNRQVGNDVKR